MYRLIINDIQLIFCVYHLGLHIAKRITKQASGNTEFC